MATRKILDHIDSLIDEVIDIEGKSFIPRLYHHIQNKLEYADRTIHFNSDNNEEFWMQLIANDVSPTVRQIDLHYEFVKFSNNGITIPTVSTDAELLAMQPGMIILYKKRIPKIMLTTGSLNCPEIPTVCYVYNEPYKTTKYTTLNINKSSNKSYFANFYINEAESKRSSLPEDNYRVIRYNNNNFFFSYPLFGDFDHLDDLKRMSYKNVYDMYANALFLMVISMIHAKQISK